LTNNDVSDTTPQGAPQESYDGVVTPALLRAARSAYRQAIREALADGGFDDLPRNGPYVLSAIINQRLPQDEIIRQLEVSKQAASQLIDTLVVRGYLVRVPDTSDRRRMTLMPTDRGRAAGTAVRSEVEAIDREFARRLSPSQLATFRTGLLALIEIGHHQGGKSPDSATRLIQFSPIFPVKDLRRALDHYKSLGFSVKAYADGDEYGFADRDGVGIHFAADPNHDPHVGAAQAYLVVEDADALAAEWSRPGIGGKNHPVGNTPYEFREGNHIDLDNNLIRFGSRVPSSPPIGRNS
jgi:DNA-binding MarR family transcriptional regulator